MVSKRLLFVALCFVVLVVAVGAYGYREFSNLNSQVDALQEENDELRDEVDSLNHTIDSMNNTRTFAFQWSPGEQDIVNGTLRMELTFRVVGEELSIVAKVNDDDYDPPPNIGSADGDHLAITFCINADWVMPLPSGDTNLFYVDNTTLFTTGASFPTLNRQPSYCHTCVFEPGVGYTFNITLSLSGHPGTLGSCQVTDLVGVAFADFAGSPRYYGAPRVSTGFIELGLGLGP